MKLNKERLLEMLYSNSVRRQATDGGDYFELYQSLLRNELEIEGYERVGWIKFDPKDPKTFPPKTDEYIVVIEGRSTSTTRKYSAEYLEFFAPEKITHWRPLPKPPGKEEL